MTTDLLFDMMMPEALHCRHVVLAYLAFALGSIYSPRVQEASDMVEQVAETIVSAKSQHSTYRPWWTSKMLENVPRHLIHKKELELWLKRGHSLVGWKLAGSVYGIRPAVTFVLNSDLRNNTITDSYGWWGENNSVGLEPEIGIYFESDLDGGSITANDVWQAADAVSPVLELPTLWNINMQFGQPKRRRQLDSTVGACVLGPKSKARRFFDGESTITYGVAPTPLRGNVSNIYQGDPYTSAAYTVNQVKAVFGRNIRRGEFIMTGSFMHAPRLGTHRGRPRSGEPQDPDFDET